MEKQTSFSTPTSYSTTLEMGKAPCSPVLLGTGSQYHRGCCCCWISHGRQGAPPTQLGAQSGCWLPSSPRTHRCRSCLSSAQVDAQRWATGLLGGRSGRTWGRTRGRGGGSTKSDGVEPVVKQLSSSWSPLLGKVTTPPGKGALPTTAKALWCPRCDSNVCIECHRDTNKTRITRV